MQDFIVVVVVNEIVIVVVGIVVVVVVVNSHEPQMPKQVDQPASSVGDSIINP